jgi:hypothetical protein
MYFILRSELDRLGPRAGKGGGGEEIEDDVVRAALGRRQPIFSYAVLVLAALSATRGPIWAFFCFFTALFLGVRHPPVENDDEPLPFGHQMLALFCLAVFLLCFTLVPMKVV